ncbi:MAG: putative peptide modification system cyclase [Thermomonas sp.]
MPAMTLITDKPQVRTLLLTDLVDSTSLVERLGDTAAAELFRAHDHMVLELQQTWRGRLIDRSDGLLLIFERPIDGLGFALDYVRGLRDLGRARDQPLQARAGLHVGEVLVWENSVDAIRVGAKSLEVEGLAKPLAGRLMGLARPGQILLSATAEPLAHRAARELGERGELLVWKSYGRWRFKGVPESQEVYEVGEPGLAPLRMPSHTPKAWRDLPLWRRPAALAAEAMVLAAMLVGGWFITQPQPAIAFGERDWVVVGDVRNLTGDARLDDSLEQAFRISLEQSRYVNIVSDLKVRETLQNMQRKPDAAVDREIGSEIALRDGARALILPTVSEVGGRLRVSAEVVDPHTQSTVYALSSDGRGIESALASIDNVTGDLRKKFGEALQSVQKTSVSLPNVATPSLDALKAFALARKIANTSGEREQVIGLYRRALELDPQFALAYSDIARLHASRGEVGLARSSWHKALAIPKRLSPQEKLGVELMLLQYDAPGPYMRKGQEYLALYPDDYRVIGRLASNQWHHRNDFSAAEALTRRTLVPQNERVALSHDALGTFLLGQEKYDTALVEYRAAKTAGYTAFAEYHARAFDVRGQHADADKVYFASTNGRDGWRGEAAVVTWIDRGQWPDAGKAAQAWAAKADSDGDVLESVRARAGIASVAVLSGDGDASKALRNLIALIDSKGMDADAVYPPTTTELRLYAGLLAAYRGDRAGVAEALRRTEGSSIVGGYPTVSQLRQVLIAEQERLAGKPQAAIARLSPLVKHDTALVATHWSLMRAAQSTGDHAVANTQRQWLRTHRGRVFVESTTTDVLRFFNIAVSGEVLQATSATAASR